MSLINDALKKVSQAERGKPQGQPVDFEMRAMQPVYENRPQHLVWISITLLAAAVGVATFVFAKHQQTNVFGAVSTVAAKANAEAPKAISVESKPSAAPGAAESAKPQVAEPIVPATAAVPISPATPAPPAQAALTQAQPAPVFAPAPAAPGDPSFRLKGILYTKNNPTALINEASVHVGGEVDGATVTKIEETSVALDYGGKSITLKLGARQP